MDLKKYIPDSLYLELMYRRLFGTKLHLRFPVTFNEKMQWLKLHDRKEIYPLMVDKYEAKTYAAERIGADHIIPTIGIWTQFDDIDIDALPASFVLKCTHDSGGLIICKDKTTFDIDSARAKIQRSLMNNYFYIGREWPYKNVEHRVLAEEYIHDDNDMSLTDYKVHSFNGIPKLILVCRNRYSSEGMTEDFFDTNWNHLDVRRPGHKNSEEAIPVPYGLEEMIHMTKLLSKDVPFLRVDFYCVNRRVLFGEMTFYPSSGFQRFIPDSFDTLLGSWLNLPR